MGSLEEWLAFYRQVLQVLKGQNITDPDAASTLIRDLLRSDVLETFDSELTQHTHPTIDNIKDSLKACANQVFPQNAYNLQKKHI